jgi:D-alanine-D-alanine ligase
MDLHVDPDWWKTLFDETYLRTDARTVCNPDLTRQETDLICELTRARPDEAILDLCGGHGRHSLELCTRGYRNLTLADYSRRLLSRAARSARAKGVTLNLIQADAREVPFCQASFDIVLILGNSLGYTHDPHADRDILSGVFELLRPGGWIVLDVTDGEAIQQSFQPSAWHEIDDDLVVCRQRHMEPESVLARELVLSKKSGMIRDRAYAIRLFTPESLKAMMNSAGFGRITIHTSSTLDHLGQDVGFMNHRLLCLGRKPSSSTRQACLASTRP